LIPKKINKDRKNIGLFPGGGKNPGLVLTTKRWALGSYTELESLLESEGFEVHFFGGELDRDLLEDIKGNMPKTNIIITKNNSLHTGKSRDRRHIGIT